MAADPDRTEQIIAQFLLKSLHSILLARIPHLGHLQPPDPPSRPRRRDRWFNLALPDLPSALEPPAGPLDPMLVDVLLDAPAGPSVVIERWSVHCDPAATSPSPAAAAAADYRKAYKKAIVLLRSLHSVLRLLPAYRLFRSLSGTSSHQSYELGYRISSFAEPFSRDEEKDLSFYSFSNVETQFGRLSLSVAYRPNLSDFDFEVASLIPPMIIADYVGSPAADPMRAFPSSPAAAKGGARATSFPLRGVYSTSLPKFHRPHSWTGEGSEPINVAGNRIPGRRMESAGHRRQGSFGFHEYGLSPPFSPSPSPSPPTFGGGNSLQSRLRAETAPVSIPVAGMGKGQVYRSPNFSDPTRSHLPPPSPRSTRMDHSSQESPSEGRSFRKSGDLYANLHLYTAQKGLRDARDDSGRFSGVFSSSGSPRFGFSRSSSRLSIQDDLDDCDFSYPFAVDDVDTSDSQTRNPERKEVAESGQANTSSHKSQDAAVGVLVHMLKTAPPLRQDQSFSSQSSKSEIKGEVGTSSYFMSRKTSDALEELRSYKEMKEILLSQSRTQLSDSVKRTLE